MRLNLLFEDVAIYKRSCGKDVLFKILPCRWEDFIWDHSFGCKKAEKVRNYRQTRLQSKHLNSHLVSKRSIDIKIRSVFALDK